MNTTSIKDISEMLNISRNTISKVLNGKGGVLPETERAIIQGAYNLGYKKLSSELLAKINIIPAPVPKNIGNVVLLTHKEEKNCFWNSVISGIYRGLSETSYALVYCEVWDDMQKLPEILLNKRANGLIVANVYEKHILDEIARLDIPTVYLDSPVDYDVTELNGDIILTEGVNSIKTITKHIISKGCARIGFIGDIEYSRTIYDRWMGFNLGCKEMGVEVLPELCFTHKKDRFYNPLVIQELMDNLPYMPQAFVCANDSIAMNVMQQLKNKGLNVPDDIMVSGYDDDQGKTVLYPHLTSVKVYSESLGKRLVQQLMWRLDNQIMNFESVRVYTKVYFRGSTG